MTGLELIRKLEESGTGKKKLEVAAACVRANPTATGEDVYEAMRQHAIANDDVGYQGTLEKAAGILRTGEWKPPEQAASSLSDKLAAELAGEKPPEKPVVKNPLPSLGERDTTEEIDKLRKENAELKGKTEKPIGPAPAPAAPHHPKKH